MRRSPKSHSSSPSKLRLKLKKGSLGNYKVKSPAKSRHSSLKKAVKKSGYSTTIKRLNVLAIYNKNQHPEIAKTVKQDIKYVQDKLNYLP